MSHKFRIYLRLLLCSVWLCCAMPVVAQEGIQDTTSADTSEESGLEGATPISGEYIAPGKAIVYNSAGPTESQWQHTVSDKAYSYKDKQEYSPKNEPPPEDPFLFKLLVKFLQFLSSPTGKFLLWTALILLVGYVAYRIIKGQGKSLFGARDRQAGDSNEAMLSEESLLENDWEARMHEALQAGDARTAIRYGYLQLLQLLQERGYISYRPDKTNMDYYKELVDKPERQPFRTITRQYEWAWYGAYEPEKAALDAYLQTLNQLKQSLGAA